MAIQTTNYTNTFIEVAKDCPAKVGEIPPLKGEVKTIANMQFEMISNHPYKFTSDDVLFQVHSERNNFTKTEYKQARALFFSKGQPCLRASPLTKRYGWGIHCDTNGRVALFGRGTVEYERLSGDNALTNLKAMSAKKL